MARKKKQTFGAGDYFTIPLADGSFSIGQVVGKEAEALNSVVCAIFSRQYRSLPATIDQAPADGDLIAVLFVTPDLLESGDWRVVSRSEPFDVAPYVNIDALRRKGFVGVRVIGSGIVITLMDAYFGLYPWNGFAKPDYLDKLLVSDDRKPKHVRLK